MHTAVCAAFIAISAEAQSASVHPEIGSKTPREMLNSDLLKLPAREQQAWIHGAVAQMATVIAGKDSATSKCVMDWYFEVGNGARTIPQVAAQFPDAPAAATVLTLARRVCPDA